MGASSATIQCAAKVTGERLSSSVVASTCPQNVLVDDSPSTTPCAAPTSTQVDPTALACAGRDDLAVALGGLGVGTSWVTRIETSTDTLRILAAVASPHVVDASGAEAGPVSQFHVVTQSTVECAVGSPGSPGNPSAIDAGTSASTTNDTTDTAAAAVADGCASGAADSCDSSNTPSETSGCDSGSGSGDSSASSGCGGGSSDASSCSTRSHRRTRASPVGYLMVALMALARRARRPRLDLDPQ
jgi:hypothetical protein